MAVPSKKGNVNEMANTGGRVHLLVNGVCVSTAWIDET